MLTPIALPNNNNVPISEFCCIFDNVTNSYKYLFFKALLEQLKANDFKNRNLQLDSIMIEMIVQAWYPCVFFKIFLGKQDQIPKFLGTLSKPNGSPRDASRLRLNLASQIKFCGAPNLLRYVPTLLLTCFFPNEFKGLSDTKKRDAIYQKSIEAFNQKKPLYKFLSKSEIEIHPEWTKYLKENIAMVEGWHSWKWLNYLQKLNLNVPNLAEKLSPPIQRSSLKIQTDYWKAVISRTDLRCIYSGQKLTLKNFELDHYLPWSFVAHDNIWNLIPVLADANRSKSDFLPSEKYFNKFVEFQHMGLCCSFQDLQKNKSEKIIESFIYDLRIQESALHDFNALHKAYSNTMLPLISLAKSMGFIDAWEYKYIG
jgi:hypothetical protein